MTPEIEAPRAWARERPTSRRRGGAIVLALIVAGYGVLGLWVLDPDAVYSGDIGVKFVQARALAASHFTSLDIPYPGQFIDTSREHFPLRPPFALFTGDSTQAIFSPISAGVQAVAVAIAGMRGMIVVSLLAAAVVVFAAGLLAEPGQEWAVRLALGIAGPLWFYAVSGWEHAPAVALSTAAFAAAVRLPVRAAPVVAGLCLGAGATLRDEVLLLAPGLALTAWLRARGIRPLLWTLAGVAVPLAAAAAIEVWWFERPVAAHLRHAVHLLQSAFHVGDAQPDVPELRPFTVRDRYEAVVQYWLLGYGADRWIIGFGAGLAVALAVRVWRGSSVGLLIWLAALIGLAAIDLRELMTAPKWLAGMLRVSPYLVFALLPLPAGSERRGWYVPVTLATALAYLALAFAGADTSGGKSLGPRLLLPLMPLLTVAAVSTLARYLAAPATVDRGTAWAGLLLVAMSTVMHLAGTIPAYVMRNRDDAWAIAAMAAAPERVVVADDQFTAQLLFPRYYRKIVFLADTPELARRLGDALQGQRVTSALLVSRQQPPGVDLSPLRLAGTEQRGRMVLQHWRK